MRDIPGFGIWLAWMTVMSGVVGCGPDKPQVGTSGPGNPAARPAPPDAADAGGDGAGATTGRPPPTIVQATDAGDGAAERAPAPANSTTTGPDGGAGSPGCAPAPATGGRAGGGSNGASANGGAGGTAAPSRATGGAPAPGSGGASAGSGGAPAMASTGGAAAPASGGGPGTGGRPNGGASGGVSGGASGGGSAAGAANGSAGAAVGGTPGSGGISTGGVTGTDGVTGGAAPQVGDLTIAELLINPTSTDTGREWIELRNRAPHALSLDGLHIADAANDAPVDFGGSAALLPPGGRAVLVQSADPAKNGGITAGTAPVVGAFGTLVSLNNDADTISICVGACTAGGIVLDRITWDATLGTGYDGHALVIDDASKRCPATVAFGDGGSFGTPGGPGTPCP